jgi:4-hydroxy-3-methylbut-2-enyl diphosphate reductase
LETEADLAIVVGGYNSSNTSHLVELCERKFHTYFISSEKEIIDKNTIHHFDYPNKKHLTSNQFLPNKTPVRIILPVVPLAPILLSKALFIKLIAFIPILNQ